MHYQAWDEIAYPFSNFNSTTVEVWQWINNFITHLQEMWLLFPAAIKINPCWKRGPRDADKRCPTARSWWTDSGFIRKDQIPMSAFSQIAKFMGPAWGPPGSCRPQMGPMLAPWTLLLGLLIYVLSYILYHDDHRNNNTIFFPLCCYGPCHFDSTLHLSHIYSWNYTGTPMRKLPVIACS